MNFLNTWEKKFGKHALPHLTRYIIMTYVAGYVLMLIGGSAGTYTVIRELIALSPSGILHGQVWRLVSWLLIPPSNPGIFTVIMLFVYYQLGSLLEQIWGDFLYNVYIFTGLIMTVVGAFLLYAFTGQDYGILFSTYYVSLSIFLGFAMTFPDQQMLFMFLIPIKIKYLAIVDIAYLVYDVIRYARYGLWLPVLVMIVSSLTGTILFFLGTRRFKGLQERHRQKTFHKQMQGGRTVYTWQQSRNGQQQRTNSRPGGAAGNPAQGSKIDRTTFGARGGRIAVHRCAVCGRTELDAPDLEFRFCSKCNGNYEYCSDHLHDHRHVT